MRCKKLTTLILTAIMLFQQGLNHCTMEVQAAAAFPVNEAPEREEIVTGIPYDTPKQVTADDAEAYQEAKQSFEALIADHDIYALLYQCESYDIREKPTYDSAPVANILTGYQVRLTGIAYADGGIWYQTEAMVNGALYSGYIEDAYLISADEGLNAWKETQNSAARGQAAPASRAGKTNLKDRKSTRLNSSH